MNAILALGSNLNDPTLQIQRALSRLGSSSDLEVLRHSGAYASAPYGEAAQPDFVNCVVEIETQLQPDALLKSLKDMEIDLGRIPSYKWGPRQIDIDIIFIKDLIVNTEELSVPHYDLHNREYLLKLLNDFCPDYIHPLFQKSITTIYHEYCTLGGV